MSAPAQKYVYTSLDQLKEGTVANVFGVVTFFKLPYRSKGTDFCCVIVIVDQSNVKLKCTFFSGTQDALPRIYKIGDIVRFHRIKVWDGTKCASLSWKCYVEDNALEGDRDMISRLQSFTIDVLVYDNHVELAKSLKIGSYIVIQNVHAKLHSTTNECQEHDKYVEFHLHGGTCYGRGITVPEDNNFGVKELQKILDAVDLKQNQSLHPVTTSDIHSSQMSLPFDALERCQQLSVTVLPVHQQWQITPLANIIKSKAPQKFCIRARLKHFQPCFLYQSVKLYCTKCNSLLDAPDDQSLSKMFADCFNGNPNRNAPDTFWFQSAVWNTENLDRAVAIHFVKKCDILQSPEDSLILLEGGSFKELCKLSSHFNTIIPVKSKDEQLEIDLSAPFIIQGNKWLYGCIKCSNIKTLEELKSLSLEVGWDAGKIAKALGVELLTHLFVMNFTLEDETGSLNAYLWRHSEQFFQIPPSEILMDSDLQERLLKIMSVLCPSTEQISGHPWMNCCIQSYNSNNGEQICYEIFDTVLSEQDLDRLL
ncbi:protection of telomeres protein 1 isoform X2 [Dendropsophus ebraccatus]|uniref:protection of telomeres protein 1 isoform X2 n=1 Tax=Dendropsophus ebraccatus TaxID=150705 RepID=UPI003831977B